MREAAGIIPVLLEQADYASIHGHNERISLENVRLGTQVLFEVIIEPYRVLYRYRTEDEVVLIMAVVHGRQLLAPATGRQVSRSVL